MTLKEAADRLGIKVRTIREWVRNGKIAAEKDAQGWCWTVQEEEVERCLHEQRTMGKRILERY